MRTKESDGSSGSSTNLVLNDPIEALKGSFGAILVKKLRFTVGICAQRSLFSSSNSSCKKSENRKVKLLKMVFGNAEVMSDFYLLETIRRYLLDDIDAPVLCRSGSSGRNPSPGLCESWGDSNFSGGSGWLSSSAVPEMGSHKFPVILDFTAVPPPKVAQAFKKNYRGGEESAVGQVRGRDKGPSQEWGPHVAGDIQDSGGCCAGLRQGGVPHARGTCLVEFPA
nr:ethylene-responsive transcription factor 2-like [Ipomoea batatas]